VPYLEKDSVKFVYLFAVD